SGVPRDVYVEDRLDVLDQPVVDLEALGDVRRRRRAVEEIERDRLVAVGDHPTDLAHAKHGVFHRDRALVALADLLRAVGGDATLFGSYDGVRNLQVAGVMRDERPQVRVRRRDPTELGVRVRRRRGTATTG